MRKPSILATLAAASLLLLTACGGDEPDDAAGDGGTDVDAGVDLGLASEGTLTVCSDVPYEPFEFEDPDAPSGYGGFDIELMQAMADELDLELAVTDQAFDGIQSGAALGAGVCDVAASAMTINDEREENVNFTEPYFDADQSLMVAADSDIESIEDLDGETVGVQADTTGQAYAVENAPEGATVSEFPDAAALFAALEARQIVAVLQDLPVNAERVGEDDSLAIVETYPTGEQYGFATAEESEPALLEALNTALVTVQEDGTYEELYRKYFPTEG